MSKTRDHEVPRSTLERFAAGDASADERLIVLGHLISDCEHCRHHLRRAGWHGDSGELRRTHRNVAPLGPPAGSYDDAFAAAQRTALAALEQQRIPVRNLLDELEVMSPEQREVQVRNRRRFAVGELALALVDRSYSLRYSDAAATLHYAQLAVAAAEAATPDTAGGRSLLADCRARAWAQLGNARRIHADQAEAEGCFATAMRHLEAGSGEPDPRAWLLRLLASLRIAQRAFAEATDMLEEAGAAYRRLKDRAGEAAVLIQLGYARICAAEPEQAIAPLQRSLELLYPWEETLMRAAAHDLVLSYIDAGHPQEAYDTVAMGEEYFEECADELARLRWTWQRGKVDRERGDLFAAERRLLRVQRGLIDAELPEKVAEISLDLAILYARQGRRPDYLRAVSEAAAMFQSLGATRELLAAVGQLTTMVHQGEAAVGLLRRLAIQCRGGVPRAEAP